MWGPKPDHYTHVYSWEDYVVLEEQGKVLQRNAQLDMAAHVFERAVEAAEKIHGEVSGSVAGSLHELAVVLQAQGDLDGARQRLERSLQIQAEVFGTEIHPSVAASLHELAGVLQAQGDLDGARQRLERALQIQTEVFGTEIHPTP